MSEGMFSDIPFQYCGECGGDVTYFKLKRGQKLEVADPSETREVFKLRPEEIEVGDYVRGFGTGVGAGVVTVKL